MRDIVRGATAAPTYFPPARIAYRRHGDVIDYVSLVDGALFANNPSQNALEFGKTIRPDDNPAVLLLSIGTGRSARKHSFNEAWNWGVLGWIDPLLEIAFSDPAIDGIVSRALEGHGDYYRLQVELGTPPVELDDFIAGRAEAPRTGHARFPHHTQTRPRPDYLSTLPAPCAAMWPARRRRL